jgi:hypothetical protein
VKKVMANAVYYSAVLEKNPAVPLKKRLGVIAPPGAAEPAVPEDESR